MFLAHCDLLGREVIIWTSDLEGVENTENGIVVRYRCACGRPAEMLTGAQSPVKINVHVGASV